MTKRYMFVSYAKPDAERVRPIVKAVAEEYRNRGLAVEVWADFTHLVPGEQWRSGIMKALADSFGMLVFVSPSAMRSDWVRSELAVGTFQRGRLIIPVILRKTRGLSRQPFVLGPGIDLSKAPYDEASPGRVAKRIADITETKLRGGGGPPPSPVTAAAAPAIAEAIAEEARGAQKAVVSTAGPPDSVFVVHGHDDAALSQMEKSLPGGGVRPIILAKLGAAQSLLQKFLTTASAARFAIVIVSADDMGASRRQYDARGVGVSALQSRARQNVILELGFFYGLLGWENVFVLQKPPNKVFPNFERPSDIEGAVFEAMDAAGNWRTTLTDKLRDAGFLLKKTAASI